MVEITWAQVRHKLMTRLARLDPTLTVRAADAEARYAASRANFAPAPEDQLEQDEYTQTSYSAESAGPPEESLGAGQDEPLDEVPEYLR